MKDPDKTLDMSPSDNKPVKASYLVAKSNKLLTAEYDLNAIEQKIILACIAQINSSKGASVIALDESFRLDAIAFSDIFGNHNKNVYSELKEAVESLFKRTVIINNPDPEPDPKFPCAPHRTKTRWVSGIDYYDDHGIVGVTFAQKVIPYLSGLTSEFNRYKLKHVAKMNSKFGIRLYELIIQWRGRGELEVEIDWLKKTFGIADQKAYNRINNFKARVIQPALDDINNYSDFWIKMGQRKMGRRVTHLQFKFGETKPKKSSAKNDLGEMIHGVPKKIIETRLAGSDSYPVAAKKIMAMRLEKESWQDFYHRNLDKIR